MWMSVSHKGVVITVEDTLLIQCSHQQCVEYNYIANLLLSKSCDDQPFTVPFFSPSVCRSCTLKQSLRRSERLLHKSRHQA